MIKTIAVVGLGYVGLPLAVEFGKKFRTLGFDLSAEKVAGYQRFVDPTGEVSLRTSRRRLGLTARPTRPCWPRRTSSSSPCPRRWTTRTSPTSRRWSEARESVGRHLKRGAIVVYESTVYPGATEEVCMPILEKHSGLKWKQDFFVGYSPGAHQPRRQGAHADQDRQGRLRRHAGDAANGGRGLRRGHHGRRPSGQQHQGRRGRQGHREHAARPQHRADERAVAHLRPHRHRHARGAGGRRHEVELPAVPARAWSAATASASTRTT